MICMTHERRGTPTFGIRCESGVAGWRPVCVKKGRERPRVHRPSALEIICERYISNMPRWEVVCQMLSRLRRRLNVRQMVDTLQEDSTHDPGYTPKCLHHVPGDPIRRIGCIESSGRLAPISALHFRRLRLALCSGWRKLSRP